MDETKDWFLKDWAKTLGKRQADLTHDLGWHKNTAYLIWHGKQPYSRDRLNTLAEWLGIEPFELLLAPRDAMALRRLRETARIIAAEPISGPNVALAVDDQ